jgi:hypothetical protein
MNFTTLNLPETNLDIRQQNGKLYVFDSLRKKYINLTPEEWVRQNFLQYLISELKYPAGLIALEAPLKLHENKMRSDILVFGKKGTPAMLVECKAAHVDISQQTFDQVIVYNMKVKAPCLAVTNGLKHYCFLQPVSGQKIEFFKNIPDYEALKGISD